ncbi:MAG: ribosome maturation factor RimM [Actinomycetota bacterium]|nr:ribosome maturation factor RimM [Actinomycetota bacterium]
MGLPRPALLRVDTPVLLDGRQRRIVRRAGTDRRPIVRLDGCESRDGASALRGQELRAPRTLAPELEGEEWWIEDLEGCLVLDGLRQVGVVRRVLALPSCEVLEVERDGPAGELLVPLVGDAVRTVDVERQRIDIDLRFLGEE